VLQNPESYARDIKVLYLFKHVRLMYSFHM
jgi:hypothetical protein